MKSWIILLMVSLCGALPLEQLEQELEKDVMTGWEEAWKELSLLEQKFDFSSGCHCVKLSCSCCADVSIKKVKLKTKACVNVNYLPKEYGIELTFTLDGKVYIHTKISAKNPPALCVGIPHFMKDASVCLDFYNLDIGQSSFSGCIKFEARLFHLPVAHVELGCFNIPLLESQPVPMVPLQEANMLVFEAPEENDITDSTSL